jgi:hypothetical protein
MERGMHELDEQELGALIEKLSENVARLAHEEPGTAEHLREAGMLQDARQLLAKKRLKGRDLASQ